MLSYGVFLFLIKKKTTRAIAMKSNTLSTLCSWSDCGLGKPSDGITVDNEKFNQPYELIEG